MIPERSPKTIGQANGYHRSDSWKRDNQMISRVITRLAPPAVLVSLIALVPAAVLLGRLGLLTDPIVLATFALALSYLAAGLLITLRRVGNPIGWLLLWSGGIGWA
jgi:hypothetical protein